MGFIAKVGCRVLMTLNAPGHGEWFFNFNHFHLIHPTMAFDATDTFIHVSTVVEKSIIRKFMDPNPFNGISRGIGFANFLDFRRIGFDLGMAIHANIDWRDTCMFTLIHRKMTIPAVNP
jgi:hypothetical protein